MKTGESWDLKHLSDNELLQGLQVMRNAERHTVVHVVAHLAEVEDRRLHLQAGHSSLFDYCLRRLGMSEGEAFRRVTAARLSRRFPTILELLAAGHIHLCAILELRDYLTPQNHQELLREASHKTRRAVKELLARHAPKAEVASTIRKLPPPRQVTTEVLAAAVEPQNPAANPVPSAPPAPSPLALPVPPTRPKTLVEPLREDRYRLQLNASIELKRKLELARDLMTHSNPSGDLAVVVERALDLLVDKLQRQRLAQTTRPRNNAKKPDKRRVSNAVRRAVVERDGLQCAYVSPDGQRCTSRQFLQFHHEHAWALGGKSTEENIKFYCFAHNQLVAEQDFGRDKIERHHHG
jgi:hypothetical protein